MDLQIFVSSAYSAMCVSVLMPSCKSFMNRTKSKGPKMDPWGTPDRTGFEEDFVHVRRDTSLKISAVYHLYIYKLYIFNLSRINTRLTESKNLEKSN